MSRGHPLSGGPVLSPEEYLAEIRIAVVASLAMALRVDPLADVVVIAIREGDTSRVLTAQRSVVVDQLRRSPSSRLRQTAKHIARSPSSHDARWVVLMAPDFCAAISIALVDHRAPAGTA